MEKAFESVSFQDCTDVDELRGGVSDRAGFVQIIRGRAKDQAAARTTMSQDSDKILASRPDILGGLMGWHGDGGGFTQVMFFRSEDEARTGEMAMHAADLDHGYREMMAGEPEFIDLPEPRYD